MTIIYIACWLWIVIGISAADYMEITSFFKKPVTVGSIVKIIFFLPAYLVLTIFLVCKKVSNGIGPTMSKIWNFKLIK